jgi:phage gp29-like protein
MSGFQIKKLAVQGLKWGVSPADQGERGMETTQLCRSFLESLSENILNMLDALPKGYLMMEIIWDASERQAMIRELRWSIPQKSPSRVPYAPDSDRGRIEVGRSFRHSR